MKAEKVCKALKEIFKNEFRVREVKYSSDEIPRFYNRREYDKIVEHLHSDLDFLEDLHYILKQAYGILLSKAIKFQEVLARI